MGKFTIKKWNGTISITKYKSIINSNGVTLYNDDKTSPSSKKYYILFATKSTSFHVSNTLKATDGNKCYIYLKGVKLSQFNPASNTKITTVDKKWMLVGGGAKITDDEDPDGKYSKNTENEPIAVEDAYDMSSGSSTLENTDVAVDDTFNDLMASSMNGIFAMPYQWMASADRRVPNADGTTGAFGRKYAEKIVSRMPLLFLTPGRPSFLSGASKEDKDAFLSQYQDVDSSALNAFVGDATDNGVNKFYTMNFAYEEYFRYVNPMCNITAKLLNLGSKKPTINGKSRDLTTFNWSMALNSNFSSYWSSANSIPFYINANVTVNESISNDTTQSQLAGQVKGLEQTSKELQYLLNSAAAAGNNDGLMQNITDAFKDITDSIANNSSASSFLSNVSKSLASIGAGGSMMFPELWGDSSVGRSYQIDIKLRSPDADNLSLYLNILVPLYHLMALAAPQMMGNNYNVYSSPFLIRAYCKSMFNIDMGIITSMDIQKGKEGAWNANGIPTEIDVSLTIKDLYDTFCITGYLDKIDLTNPVVNFLFKKEDAATRIVKNTAMMDYLCNNAGLNINSNEVYRTASVYKLIRGNTIKNWPNNKWLKLQQAIDNRLQKVYKPGI